MRVVRVVSLVAAVWLLVVTGFLLLATHSLADDNPPPICPGLPCGGPVPGVIPVPLADWKMLGGNPVRKEPPRPNRIYYARTPAGTRRWSPYIQPSDRRLLQHLNFSRDGVLAVFLSGQDRLDLVGPVLLTPRNGLTVQASRPSISCAPASSCGIIPGTSYTLLRIRKNSLPYPVRLLYISIFPN